MMRSLVFLLIFGNIVVFALSAGWIGVGDEAVVVPVESHQPLSPDRIRIVSRGEPPQPAAPSSQCLEWRALSGAQADAIEALAASQKNLALSREQSPAAASTYRVFIAVPKGGQAGAEKKAAELKKLGIKDFQLGKDGEGEAWAIELGVYDDEPKASQALADFRKAGARSAQLEQRREAPAQYRIRASGLPEALASLRPAAGAPQPCPPELTAGGAARDTPVAPGATSDAPVAAAAPTSGNPKP